MEVQLNGTCSQETTNLLSRNLGGVYAIMEITLERQIPIFLLRLRTPAAVCRSGGGDYFQLMPQI
jgi:hypothetical protein